MKNHKTREKLRSLIVFPLLFLYILGNTEFDSLHKLIHPTVVVAHTHQQEEDSCHRAIYHNEPEKNCGHRSHNLFKAKCYLCDVICHSDQYLIGYDISSKLQFVDQIKAYHQIVAITTARVNLATRAPPQLS